MTHNKTINLIKEFKTLIELLRESLTNLTTKPHVEPDPKKNLQLQFNETKDQIKQTKQKSQVSILSPPKKIG